MPKYKYICPPDQGGCGNEIHAETVERRVRGSKRYVRVLSPVTCECGRLGAMVRTEYTPERRGVSPR